MGTGEWADLRRTFGKDLHTSLSEILFRTVPDAILELLSNAYDADATRVEIIYDTASNQFSHKDDGCGMGTPKRIRGFYCRGDSAKRTLRKTAKGRTPIGKFGLAASLLQYLANAYVLDTMGDGNQVVIEEDFRITKGGEVVPTPKVTKADPAEHGTIITLKDLKFLEAGKTLDLDELVRRVSREMPVQDDFVVYVNGTRVALPKIERAEVFYLSQDVPKVGRVWGEFYLCPSKLENGGGIYLKVNGRAVGDPQSFFQFGKTEALRARPGSAIGMSQRLLGYVYADGLDPRIAFDRTRFEEDHPNVLAVKEVVANLLGVIRRYYDAAVDQERRAKGKSGLRQAAKKVQARFARLDQRWFPHGKCEVELLPGEGSRYPVELDLEPVEGSPKALVYTGHPYFTGVRNAAGFNMALTAALDFIVGRERAVRRKEWSPEADASLVRAYSVFHQPGKLLDETLSELQPLPLLTSQR